MHILIHAGSLRVAGGLRLGKNLINNIAGINSDHEISVLLSNSLKAHSDIEHSIKCFYLSRFYQNLIFRFLFEYFYLPFFLKHQNVNIILNLTNIALPVNYPQVLLLQWPYAVYPDDDKLWQGMSSNNFIKRKMRLYLIKKRIKFTDMVTVQTKVIKDRLCRYYDISSDKILIISSAVEPEVKNKEYEKFFNSNDEAKKLLYISRYYTHKNFEILIPLAQKIKNHNHHLKIFITISASDDPKANEFLQQIKATDVQDIVINLSPIPFEKVPSLYQSCNGLLFPTLLETFGFPYIEAMHYKLPIFTSDLDFAHHMCQDAAVYFDPHSAQDIFEKLVQALNDEIMMKKLIVAGEKRLKEFPNWNQVAEQYLQLLEQVYNNRTRNVL